MLWFVFLEKRKAIVGEHLVEELKQIEDDAKVENVIVPLCFGLFKVSVQVIEEVVEDEDEDDDEDEIE
jgi:hypothetical protein